MRQQKRSFSPSARLRVEARGSGKGSRIVGHASVFDQWTELYRGKGYVVREIVRSRAFRNALKERQDVRALFNHNPDFVLGRTASRTLRLSEDSAGLVAEIDPPGHQWARELLESINRGDVSGMSFSFLPRDGGYKVRDYTKGGTAYLDYELTDADLFDVAVVTYPAYPGTDVEARSLDEIRRSLGLTGGRSAPTPEVSRNPDGWYLDLSQMIY